MPQKKSQQITNKDLMDFMGDIAETVTKISSTMATKDDLRDLENRLVQRMSDVEKKLDKIKTEMHSLIKTLDEDHRAAIRTITNLQRRVKVLEKEVATLKQQLA